MAHVIASTDLDQVLSRIATRQGLLDLVLGQYGLPTSTPARPIKAGQGVARVCDCSNFGRSNVSMILKRPSPHFDQPC
jgi:hypothetical protein